MDHRTIAHPEVLRVAVDVLTAHGVTPEEIRSAVADVLVRAVEDLDGVHRIPTTLRDWQTHVGLVAVDYAVDERGKEPADLGGLRLWEMEGEDWLADVVFGNPRGRIAADCHQAFLMELFGDHTLSATSREVFRRAGERHGAKSIARALGMGRAEVRAQLRWMRTRFFRRLVDHALRHGGMPYEEPVAEQTEEVES